MLLHASRVRNSSPEAEGTRPQVRLRIYVASLHQGSPASGVLRRAVARLFFAVMGYSELARTGNRTNLIGIALYGVAAMAGPKTPRELAHRMRDHRAQHPTRDGFVRETFNTPRYDARQRGRD